MAQEVHYRSDIPDYTEDTSEDPRTKITMRTGIILIMEMVLVPITEADYTEDTSDQDVEYYE